MALTPMYAWSIRREVFGVCVMNGPKPRSVPQMAIPASKKMAVAVSRWPKRKAAQISMGIHKKAKG